MISGYCLQIGISYERAGRPAIKGNSVQLFLEGSKKKDIAKALEEIREANREYKAILVTMDNFKSHLSCEVREKTDELGIKVVYLP